MERILQVISLNTWKKNVNPMNCELNENREENEKLCTILCNARARSLSHSLSPRQASNIFV